MATHTQDDELDEVGIAIIGMAGRFPGAQTLEQFWGNLEHGVDSISSFAEEELAAAGVARELLRDPHYVKAGAVLQDIEQFDASFFGLSPREAQLTDPQQRVFLETAWEAMEAAGYATEHHRGAVGVFAGAGFNSYLMRLPLPDSVAEPGALLQLLIGNDKDFLATRVAYAMNLQGPCLTVQTACSTSLVAVHLAVQSLLSGECDLALAGGVAIAIPQQCGYLYQQGGTVSPDGRCRAFDEKAQGFVLGRGAGVVVLKRLEEARAHGDFIRAVIRGSAVNNDGSSKIGYTAPSIEGQAAVIESALAMARVQPRTVTYVETHGTATALGDSIEVLALTQAFRRQGGAGRWCALGSVKTNIGHTDVAAGVIGLIKTVLALEHRMIPPTLNFVTPNPTLGLESSPFYINAALADWVPAGCPRRAGVSSFGIGGTNAHVVLEEAPSLAPSDESRALQLVALSAKTSGSLTQSIEQLAEYLDSSSAARLADVAYTLHVGRRRFTHRAVALCTNREDAVRLLRDRDPTCLLTCVQEAGDREIVLLLPAEWERCQQTSRLLYDCEPGFRQVVDQCAGLFKSGLDQFAAPAVLFVAEYTLARLWMEWGISPGAIVGEGIGELVAACLAGEVALEQALSIAATPTPHQSVVGRPAAVEGLLGNPDSIWLEMGSGRMIQGLLARQPALSARDCAIASVGPEETESLGGLFRAVGQLWLHGAAIDWAGFHARERRHRVPLPTYPFDRRRYWIDGPSFERSSPSDIRTGSTRRARPVPARAGGTETRDHDYASAVGSTWRSVLGREVGVDEDFFDAGGNSLLAVELVAGLSRRFGLELAPDLLLEHSTIAAVTDFVRRAGTSADRSPRPSLAASLHLPIRLTHGVESQALFLVHPVGGLAYFYGDLAERLGQGPRVSCFQSRGLLDGEEPHRQVEAMARNYVEGLLSVHPSGPYWLGGASFGGTVAFEMAHQLHARGHTPEGLVLIDTPGPSQLPPPIEGDEAIAEYLMGVLAESGTDPRRFLAAASDPASALRERPELQRIVRVFEANMKAMFDYMPQPYLGRIVYFRALERRAGVDPPHPERPWIDLALGGIEIHQVGGNHISMNFPPHVDTLAQILRARMDSGRM